MCSNYPGIKLEPALWTKKSKLNICHHMLKSSKQLQNRSFHVVERTRTSTKCQKIKNARAKRAKILFFIVKYANLWGFRFRCRRGCLSSLTSMNSMIKGLVCKETVAQHQLGREKQEFGIKQVNREFSNDCRK